MIRNTLNGNSTFLKQFRLCESGNCPHSHPLSRLVSGSDQIVVVSSGVWGLRTCWICDHLLSPARHDTECQMPWWNRLTWINRSGDWRQRCLHTVLRLSSGGEELQRWRDHRRRVISKQLSDMCRYSGSDLALAKSGVIWSKCWKANIYKHHKHEVWWSAKWQSYSKSIIIILFGFTIVLFHLVTILPVKVFSSCLYHHLNYRKISVEY